MLKVIQNVPNIVEKYFFGWLLAVFTLLGELGWDSKKNRTRNWGKLYVDNEKHIFFLCRFS